MKPTTAAAAGSVALAGLAFAGVAGAPAASAGTPTGVWDRVAHCESTNDWHINTGNGFYGGLQFSQSTWSAYHGGKYADRADQATRTEQIWVARRVLDAQGPGAWPVCSKQAGLTRSNGGATSTSLPDASDQYATASVKVAHRAAPKAHAKKAAHHGKRVETRYHVRRGDTLHSIAQHYHVPGGWHALWNHNKKRVHNPNSLHVGQLLLVSH